MPTQRRDVAHFLRRAGFGGLPAEIDQLSQLSKSEMVDAMINASPPGLDPPGFVNSKADKWENNGELIHWWLDRMATSPAPLAEKMTLFWHGHFTSSLEKCELQPMWKQHLIFREMGMGSFKDLAQAVAISPAMLQYLDNSNNSAKERNENFARELLELFMLGHGNYTQEDVVAAARAWTGHGTDKDDYNYIFSPEDHDMSQKKFLGVTRNWDGPEIIEALCSGKTATVVAKHIATRMWTFFAYPNPESKIIDALASEFVKNNLEVKALVRALFLRDEFYSDKCRQGHVRGPIEFVVAATRYSGVPIKVTEPQWQIGNMGQKPFWPPNVAGWPGDRLWITNSSMWYKGQFAMGFTWAKGYEELFEDLKELPPRDAARTALARFGIDEPSANTVSAMEKGVIAERAQKSWAERNHLIVWALLAPEFQVA